MNFGEACEEILDFAGRACQLEFRDNECLGSSGWTLVVRDDGEAVLRQSARTAFRAAMMLVDRIAAHEARFQ